MTEAKSIDGAFELLKKGMGTMLGERAIVSEVPNFPEQGRRMLTAIHDSDWERVVDVQQALLKALHDTETAKALDPKIERIHRVLEVAISTANPEAAHLLAQTFHDNAVAEKQETSRRISAATLVARAALEKRGAGR